MLETQRGSKYQNHYCGNLADAPITQNLTALIPALFPEASDMGCSCSGVAGDKVAWADCAGDVGAFGEVLSLVAGSEDAAVTAGSWSSPSGYLATFGGYGQCPASVNELYGTPANLVLSQDVYDLDSVLTNLNSGKPKEQQRDSHYQCNTGQRDKCDCESLAEKNYNPGKCHDDTACESYGPAGSRSEYLHAKSLACLEEVLSVG